MHTCTTEKDFNGIMTSFGSICSNSHRIQMPFAYIPRHQLQVLLVVLFARFYPLNKSTISQVLCKFLGIYL